MNDLMDHTTDEFERALAEALRVEAGRAPRLPASWSESPLHVVGGPSSDGPRRAGLVDRRAGVWVAAACVSLVVGALVVLGGDDARVVPGAPGGSTAAQGTRVTAEPGATGAVGGAVVVGEPTVPIAAPAIDESVVPLDPAGLLGVDTVLASRVALATIENLVHECMAGEGFDYRSLPEYDRWLVEPVYKDERHRASYGYGPAVVPAPPDVAASTRPTHVVTSPADYKAQFDDPAVWTAYMGSDPTAQMGGCLLDAYTTVYPDGVAVPTDNDEWNEAVREFDATTYGTVELIGDLHRVRRVLHPTPSGGTSTGDPHLLDIAAPWSACMLAAGVEVTTPHDLEVMAERVRLADRAGPQPDDVAGADEVAVAMADLRCQVETGITAAWFGRIAQLVREFSEQHGALVGRIQAWYTRVAARVAEAEARLAG